MISEEPGFLAFSHSEHTAELTSIDAFPLNGWYKDDDGALVQLLLHTCNRDRLISMLERFRPDGEPIINLKPAIETIAFQLKPPIAESRGYVDGIGWVELDSHGFMKDETQTER